MYTTRCQLPEGLGDGLSVGRRGPGPLVEGLLVASRVPGEVLSGGGGRRVAFAVVVVAEVRTQAMWACESLWVRA